MVKLIFCLYFTKDIFKEFIYSKSERMLKSLQSLFTKELVIIQKTFKYIKRSYKTINQN